MYTEKLDQIIELLTQLTLNDEVLLDRIKSQIRMVIHRAFGEQSHYLVQLDKISFYSIVYPVEKEYEMKVWNDGAEKLRNLLDTIRDDLSFFNPETQGTATGENKTMFDNNRTSIILFLSADPTDASRLRLGQEMRDIDNNLRMSQLRSAFELKTFTSVRPAELARAMLETKPTIVHFSGHGTEQGALCFENDNGQSQLISPEAVQALFAQFADSVECVLLNACYSEIQATAIAQHIPYVIGMDTAIGDAAAIAFAVGFYQAIGAGTSVEKAFHMGKVQIMLNGIPEHLTPTLIKQTS
ncbi:MAG: CHAT domain-containing protein [Anaerolineales bacterium]|nr:CHAT domain-containing protein [Anaerolineales bacterium]